MNQPRLVQMMQVVQVMWLVWALHRMVTPDQLPPHRAGGADGQLHAEAARPGPAACLCGFTASGPAGLDEHIVAAFIPADGVGRDGKEHVLATK